MTCFLNTQILLNPGECEGLFTFTPDLITDPSANSITDLNVSILKNCKDDLKVTLLDENGCALDSLVLRCGQYRISDISGVFPDDTNASLADLYSTDYIQIIQINANNLNLVGEYVAFEETAYFYRRVQQTYLNLWCGAERNGIVCYILNQTLAAATALDPDNDPTLAQFVYSMGNDLIKARVVALKQLCDCGKVCNDQFFVPPTNPCQALRGCCPRPY
jgi:hypothetical protein